MIHRLINSKPRLAALALTVLVIAGVSCGDFTGVPASLPTVTDSGTAYALNGAPLGAPTALHGASGTLIPADANFVFDVAFDLDSVAGTVLVLPQRAVASGLATTHQVSLATVDGDFASVTSVPKSLTFRADTALRVNRNQVVIAQITDATQCGFSLSGTTLFVKFAIRSINRDARTMDIIYTSDPNCGFRSFASGVPKD